MNTPLISQDSSRLFGFAALASVVVGNAIGNLLLKLGADARGANTPLFGFATWQTLGGIACFGFGILAYAWALKQFDLHVAQVVVSLQYVAAILLAALVLGEHVTSSQWLGMALVAVGLYICLR
ncbi:MAG: EamA family transporter [Rhodanobacteraceae bacterium]